MGLGVVLMGVVGVVRGEDRRVDLASDLEQLWVGGALLGDALILQLDEEVVAPEDVLETSGVLEAASCCPCISDWRTWPPRQPDVAMMPSAYCSISSQSARGL